MFASLHGALQNIEKDILNKIQDETNSAVGSLQANQALVKYTSDVAKVVSPENKSGNLCSYQCNDIFFFYRPLEKTVIGILTTFRETSQCLHMLIQLARYSKI